MSPSGTNAAGASATLHGRHRPGNVVVAAALLVATVTATTPASASHDGPPFPVKTEYQTVEMSDGVRLAVRIHRPDDAERHPALVTFTPYGARDGVQRPDYGGSTYSTKNYGWARILVDVRGTGSSEGSYCLLCEREQQDAVEVVEWMSEQSWSDGNVAAFGLSYSGIIALLAAARGAPLRTVVALSTYSEPYRDTAWHNGMFNANFTAQWFAWQTATANSGITGRGDLEQQQDVGHVLARASGRPAGDVILERARAHPYYDSFYRERSIYEKREDIDIPVLLFDGWFDGFSRGALWNLQGIQNSRLVMTPFGHNFGAWDSEPTSACTAPTHGCPPTGYEGAMSYNAILEMADTWLEKHLVGDSVHTSQYKLPDDCDLDAPWRICYFNLGGEDTQGWIEQGSWPPPRADTRELYLSGAQSAPDTSTVPRCIPGGGPLAAGTLVDEPPAGDRGRPECFVYDPTSGITEAFSKWGDVAATPRIDLDQNADEIRTLTYTTPALTEPLRLAGPMELRFWASTTAEDMDWVVKVSQVDAEGTSTLITSGYLRASQRHWDDERSRDGAPWITNREKHVRPPGDGINEYRIDIWDTAWTVPSGSHLRVSVSSSDVPSHEPGPWAGAVNTIYHDGQHPSRLIVTTADDLLSSFATADTSRPRRGGSRPL